MHRLVFVTAITEELLPYPHPVLAWGGLLTGRAVFNGDTVATTNVAARGTAELLRMARACGNQVLAILGPLRVGRLAMAQLDALHL